MTKAVVNMEQLQDDAANREIKCSRVKPFRVYKVPDMSLFLSALKVSLS